MDERDNTQQYQRTMLYVFFTVLSMIVVLYGIVFVPSDQQYVQAVEDAFTNLWIDADEEHTGILRSDIECNDLDQVATMINRLHGEDYDQYQSLYQSTEQQWQMLEAVRPVLANNPSDSSQGVMLRPNITQEEIEACVDKVNQLSDSYREDALNSLAVAHEQLNQIQVGLHHLNEYYAFETLTRSNLNDAMEQLNLASSYIEPIIDIPYFEPYRSEYDAALKHFGEVLLQGYNAQPYSEWTLNQISENDRLMEVLKGSPINPIPQIALTFDDGPNEEITPQLLDVLKEYNVKATFFVYGAYVEMYPEVAQRIINEGHQLGNHSYSHPNFEEIEDEDIKNQFYWTQEIIKEVTGADVELYRMPFGAGGYRVVEMFPELTSTMWNLDSLDWMYQDTSLTYEQIKSGLSNDTLLLMHDTHQSSVDVMKQLIPELIEMGYEFVMPQDLHFQARYFEAG